MAQQGARLNQSSKPGTRKNPDVFSRGALELTFRLLRHQHPALALQIQNILAGKPLPGAAGAASDHFYVGLDPRSIGRVVAALTDMGQQALERDSSTDGGRRVVIKTLIHEWMTLAEWIIIQAQDESSALH